MVAAVEGATALGKPQKLGFFSDRRPCCGSESTFSPTAHDVRSSPPCRRDPSATFRSAVLIAPVTCQPCEMPMMLSSPLIHFAQGVDDGAPAFGSSATAYSSLFASMYFASSAISAMPSPGRCQMTKSSASSKSRGPGRASRTRGRCRWSSGWAAPTTTRAPKPAGATENGPCQG